ncbi:hypothetical protein [Sphingomonas sp.]|uniref:hypothetical protein n=1 Tax=Sphingomonas sp. TaxID=28214 RepID=UPI00286CECDF|nr:hypothetical protein [Sphingomonas sp.]
MKNRTPAIANGGKPIAFAPVPRKHRHDGWTPERQRAFIDALADTGSVSRAAAMVNMSSVGAYYLRRQPAAEDFAAAWSAALDHGVLRMKDIAFERAVEGELVPILAGGKLIGYRRRFNDRLLHETAISNCSILYLGRPRGELLSKGTSMHFRVWGQNC